MDYEEALEVLCRFEYSSEGWVKRYPDEASYGKALNEMKELVYRMRSLEK